ncbi:hypothetical protein B6D60_10645 [candidate division KSB1 bacterium 4484_87]|nr:MAG: hypothetical protein B6D60_10645 [candidate division KSB1 bacterium 4484_87]
MRYLSARITVLLTVFLVSGFINTSWCQNAAVDSVQVKAKMVSEKEDSLKTDIKSPRGALVRSLLFPGLGQWYNGKKLKAVVMFLGQTGLAANAVYLNQQLVKSKTDYEREFYINNRNISVWWLVGVTLFSIADAYVDAQLSDFDESPDLSHLQIQPKFDEKSRCASIVVCYRF